MDLQKIATYGTAAAVVGTGSIVGGNVAIDNATGGPDKRIKARQSELQLIVREEVYNQLVNAWPKTSGPVKGLVVPRQDYREQVPQQ